MLTQDGCTLDSLNLYNALCAVRIDWTLGYLKLAILLAFVAFSFAPAALWAGAITPIIVSVVRTGHILVPSYSNATYIDIDAGNKKSFSNTTVQGVFSWWPHLYMTGTILDNLREASSRDKTPSTQVRPDNINYRYMGRSHGVGSSCGLQTPFVDSKVQAYEYMEAGLLVTSECLYNSSSACYFQELTPDGFSLNVYNSIFQQPNKDEKYYIAAAGQNAEEILVLGASANRESNSDTATHFATIISPAKTNGQYGRLHQIQCEMKFAPTNFQISVNVTNNTIVVQALDPANKALFPDYPDFTRPLTGRVAMFGQLFASTQWRSTIGDAFLNNINNLAFARNESKIGDETVLEAVSASMNSIYDTMLTAISAAQTILLNDTTNVPVKITYQAVQYGERSYICATAVLNSIVTLIFFLELWRTRFWKIIPKFDLVNAQDLVLAGSAGGTAIAHNAHRLSLSKVSSGQVHVILLQQADECDKLVPSHHLADDEEPDLAHGIRAQKGFQLKLRPASRMYEQL
ncbi:hypothetical protein H2198_009827 [Neophaeococcomyces mojaviensis]|uniref:Uncharacterized protein n=1 Tax=Neophaeococcomyces mojaviensis TaxID=3383035 RepID=A0ACC2ZTP4_9EURO|nr:hypothetical protein H2198_009827 [Knufia sp. JES_112]